MRRSRHPRRITTSRLTNPRVLPQELIRRLENDPVFLVMTSDRQTWIEPYTGTGVPASLGRITAAREFLLENENLWRNGQSTLPFTELEYERWRKDLIKLLPSEPRLRIFGRGGSWMNPYSGEFISDIPRDAGKITLRTVAAMARRLCLDTAARSGRLLEPKVIADLLRRESIQVASPTAAVPTVDEAMVKASTVQRQMLPELPKLKQFSVAVHYRAHHGVSGDFYDFLTLPDGRLLVIGDVSGHGLQAALVVATALKTLRFVARSHSSLTALLSKFNDEVKVDLVPGQFMTLVAVALDQGTREVACVRAGHHPCLLATLGGDTILKRIGRTGMAIGLATGRTFSQSLREDHFVIKPGEVLVNYTDGLIEAVRPDDTAYGEARFYASVIEHLELEPQALADTVAQEVSDWAGGPVGDDVTVLVLAALAESEAADSGELPQPMRVQGIAAEPLEVDADEEIEVEVIVPRRSFDELEPSESGELEAPAVT